MVAQRLLNALPVGLRSVVSADAFKKLLETYLIKTDFGSVDTAQVFVISWCDVLGLRSCFADCKGLCDFALWIRVILKSLDVLEPMAWEVRRQCLCNHSLGEKRGVHDQDKSSDNTWSQFTLACSLREQSVDIMAQQPWSTVCVTFEVVTHSVECTLLSACVYFWILPLSLAKVQKGTFENSDLNLESP